jgi:hypothetical protein
MIFNVKNYKNRDSFEMYNTWENKKKLLWDTFGTTPYSGAGLEIYFYCNYRDEYEETCWDFLIPQPKMLFKLEFSSLDHHILNKLIFVNCEQWKRIS